MKVVWTNQALFKKVPLFLVLLIVAGVGFNVYLNLKIQKADREIAQIRSLAQKPPRIVPLEFAKKIELGGSQCPSIKAGNPNAPLKFKVFESETCPYCIAQNKVIDELLLQYGDLIYGEWYQVLDCQREAEQYGISGVPTFVFNVQDVEKSPAYGFLDKQQLTDYICRVSGQC